MYLLRVARVLLIGLAPLLGLAVANAEVIVAGENNPEYKATIYRPAVHDTASSKEPVTLNLGPHLFIDDFLIDKTTNVTRHVNCPKRIRICLIRLSPARMISTFSLI